MAMQAAMKATARSSNERVQSSKAMKSSQATVKSATQKRKAKVQSSKAKVKSSVFEDWSLYNVREVAAIWVAATITRNGKLQVNVFSV